MPVPTYEDLVKEYHANRQATGGNYTPSIPAVGFADRYAREQQAIASQRGVVPTGQSYEDYAKLAGKEQLQLDKLREQQSILDKGDYADIDHFNKAYNIVDKLNKGFDAANKATGGWFGNPIGGIVYQLGMGQTFYQHPEVEGYYSLLSSAKPILNTAVEGEGKAQMGSKYSQISEKLPIGTTSIESKNYMMNNNLDLLREGAQDMITEYTNRGVDMKKFGEMYPQIVQASKFTNPNSTKGDPSQVRPEVHPDAQAVLMGSNQNQQGNPSQPYNLFGHQ